MDGKRELEEVIGIGLTSFCYPYGSFNNEVIAIVKRGGFIGSRTAKLFTRSLQNPLKMGTTVYAKDLCFAAYIKHGATCLDHSLFLFTLKKNLFFKGWDQIAVETLDFVIENGGIWHLWGHSWEIDSNNEWGELEKVLRQISMLSKEVTKLNNSQLLRTYVNNRQERELE